MSNEKSVFAYIDGANLHKGINELGWKLDYKRFRLWLSSKYGVTKAYLFLGLVPQQKYLYTRLQEFGYTLVFKEVTYDGSGKIKGNCDADLVLRAVRDIFETEVDSVVLVSSDGDYSSLANFLIEKNKLSAILSPSNKCSILLRRLKTSLVYLNPIRHKLDYVKRKAPDTAKP